MSGIAVGVFLDLTFQRSLVREVTQVLRYSCRGYKGSIMAEQGGFDLSAFIDDYLNDVGNAFQEFDDTLMSLEKDPDQPSLWDQVFRAAHTVKGSSRMMEFFDIQDAAHVWESLLDSIRKNDIAVTQYIMDILFDARDNLEVMVEERAKEKKPTISSELEARCEDIKERIASALEAPQISDSKDEQTPQANEATTESGEQSPAKQTATKAHVIEKGKMVRVNVDLLDELFDLAGELIITKNRVDNLVASIENKALTDTLLMMNRMIKQLRESISEARLVPVDETFQKFPRMVRDLAKAINKEINFTLAGREIELDKGMLDSISEPLMHILRNAVDHGIETPEERKKNGKPKTASVNLAASSDESSVLFEVKDDGAGIDPEKIKTIALARGFITEAEAEAMNEKSLIDLLFRPGFSSAKEVTDISGRGVGLDVVSESVKNLGGTVEVESEKGVGSRFILRLPLSTAIMETLMVNIGDQFYAVPSTSIETTLDVKLEDIQMVGNQRAICHRGKVIHFLPLDELLNIKSGNHHRKSMTILVANHSNGTLGIGVDEVVDHIENIIKPLGDIAQQTKGFAGGTIMGDGRVALLLDIPSLVNAIKTRQECTA